MNSNPTIPHRRNLHLPEFDYSQPGAYFVTIVTQDRRMVFGQVVNGEMVLNEVGKIVEEVWGSIPAHFANVELGEFVVMPNHIHGIISIANVGATHASPLLPRISQGPAPGSIGSIIGSFKSTATRRVCAFTNNHEKPLWQRNYYEHIIRNERDYLAIYDYILANPMNWEKDEENARPLR